jgi:hypothetical protein
MVLIKTKGGNRFPSVAKSYYTEGRRSCLPSDTSGLVVSGCLFAYSHHLAIRGGLPCLVLRRPDNITTVALFYWRVSVL